MKKLKYSLLINVGAALLLSSCASPSHDDHGHAHGAGEEKVRLSIAQMESMEIETGTLELQQLSGYVESNGKLEVPPQNEALVSSVIGGNITQIMVIEGEPIGQGEVLATISHPDLIELQTNYVTEWNRRAFLKNEFDRQKRLYDEKVGSGKEFQKIESEYQSVNGKVLGLEAQLRLLHLSSTAILEGQITEHIKIKSPINGFVRKVEVKMGQYVDPQKELFDIVNIDHVHADFMVYENDIAKVKEGQTILFTVEGNEGKEMKAEIYTVGKNFEEDPKAVHLHAEIENKNGFLLPGMYIQGKILVDQQESWVLPESGIVREGDTYFVFRAVKMKVGEAFYWDFFPEEVNVGTTDRGYTEVKPLNSFKQNQKLATQGAYYIMAELKKEEAEHSH